jgi:type IV secretory pathway TraG/TraD family ATPase VirD4
MSELAFSGLLDMGIKEDRRIWFVIDELSALGKLPSLSTLMAEGRKYGACVLSGLQSLNQLYSNYGQYEGSTIFGQFGTNFFFRNNEPAIAKMVSNICGRETIYRQQKNTSFGAHEFRDGVSYSEQQQQKDLVEYSDLAGLAAGECFVLLPEPQVRVVKLQTPEVKLANKNAGFIQSENLTAEREAQEPEQDTTDTDEQNIDRDKAGCQAESEDDSSSSQSLDEVEQKHEQNHDLDSEHSVIKY